MDCCISKETYRYVKAIFLNKHDAQNNAVKIGLDNAGGDILITYYPGMLSDPKELKRFYNLLASGRAEFINATRLIYPVKGQALRQLNITINLIFSRFFSWLLGQRITDILSDNKAFFRKDYLKIKKGISSFQFDLLFLASKNKLNILEMPIHYREYSGKQNYLRSFKRILILLKMCFVGYWKLKIIPQVSLFVNLKTILDLNTIFKTGKHEI